MKKIELTPRTLGTVMNLLQQATAGQFAWAIEHDQRPLEIKKFDYGTGIDTMAEVIIHWKYGGEAFESEEPKKNETPLIQLMVNGRCFRYYSYGDNFYFKGKQIIIDRKGDLDIKSTVSEHYRAVESIFVIKYAKSLTENDKDIAKNEKRLALLNAEEMSDDFEHELI